METRLSQLESGNSRHRSEYFVPRISPGDASLRAPLPVSPIDPAYAHPAPSSLRPNFRAAPLRSTAFPSNGASPQPLTPPPVAPLKSAPGMELVPQSTQVAVNSSFPRTQPPVTHFSAPMAAPAALPAAPPAALPASSNVCLSCKSTESPGWRKSWKIGSKLCNGCGLKWQRAKAHCRVCAAVPSKIDIAHGVCPRCSSSKSFDHV